VRQHNAIRNSNAMLNCCAQIEFVCKTGSDVPTGTLKTSASIDMNVPMGTLLELPGTEVDLR